VFSLNTYDEYSDSEEESDEDLEPALKLNAIAQLMKDEYKLIRNKNKLLDMSRDVTEEQFRKEITLRVDMILLGQEYSDRMRSFLIDKAVRTYKRGLHLELNAWMLDNLEYLTLEKEGPVKDKEENWTQRFKDDESDEEFEWVKTNEESTYISFVNNNRRPIKKGEQIFYNYGRRSNQFLLIDYGFCF
jgi:hypothetical protein